MWLCSCCRPLVELSLRPDDSPEERDRKTLWITILVVLVPLGFIALYTYIFSFQYPLTQASTVGMATAVLGCVVGLLYPLITKRLPLTFVGIVVHVFALGILVLDLNTSALGSTAMPPWTFLVLVMDLLLVVGAQRGFQISMVVMITSHLVMTHIEQAFRLGLFDIDGFTENGERAAKREDCADIPCRRPYTEVFPTLAGVFCVLIGDYYVTRQFAMGLREEKRRVLAAVRVSERVARLLADYATGDARRVVAEEGAALPSALRNSYEELLDNLDSYRAFLPDALMYAAQQRHENDAADESEVLSPPQAHCPPPGYGQELPEVAVCFTDIQNSTGLWDAYPQGMYEALTVHNKVIRDTYSSSNGYEVKTIGDSFMVAFGTVAEAVHFGLEVQRKLVRQQWPDDVMTHPLCRRVAAPGNATLWAGLRIRIGLQYGTVVIERNPVTLRYDYFGQTVNVAARLEAVLRVGGVVATSDSVVERLSADVLSELGNPVVQRVGPRSLRGVADQVVVYLIVPPELAQRKEAVHAAMQADQAGAVADIGPRRRFTNSIRAPSSPNYSERQSSLSGGSPMTPDIHSVMIAEQGPVAEALVEKSPRSAASERPPEVKPVWHTTAPRGDSAQDSARASRSPAPYQLQCTSATCAVARVPLCGVSDVAKSMAAFLTAAVHAADRSQGVVESVLSACVFVTWNASKPCVDHAPAGRHFLGAPCSVPRHLGAASGSVTAGSIFAGRRSFATAIGGCVELAAALAEEAERCGDAALAACAVAEGCVAAGAAFCAQLWQAPGSPALVVYEVHLEESGDKWLLDGGTQDQGDAGAGQCPAELFKLACTAERGSPEADAVLVQLRDLIEDGEDSELAHLARRVAEGTARVRPIPRLRDLICAGGAEPAAGGAVGMQLQSA